MLPENGRVVIVAAHPDDETIGVGGVIGRFEDPIIVHVTGGAPRGRQDREEYARTRRHELLRALELAGIGPERTRELGVVDQEAALDLPGLARRLTELLAECRPRAVFTHPYEGGHPDHDAAAFAARAAERELGFELYEFTSYHERDGELVTGEFLAWPDIEIETVLLPAEARERKRRMLDCFATQWDILRHFRVECERFRRAPPYDFSRPPNNGIYWYDRFGWPITLIRGQATKPPIS
jgi:LmbE family N-acetylglucosaminyl deacetylase